jgi:hypothetical protein
MDIRGNRHNIPCMMARITANAVRFLIIGAAMWQLCPETSWASTSAHQPVRLMVPGVDAACRADADQRARTGMRLKFIEWADGPAEPAEAQRDAHAITRVEIAGRARSANGWVRLTADCTYAKGRPPTISLHVQPEPALDLSNITRLSAPQPDANTQISQLALPGGSGSSEPTPSVRVKPSLTELPFDPLTLARKQDFLTSHQFGIKLQAPF